jgi:hypothetical protein
MASSHLPVHPFYSPTPRPTWYKSGRTLDIEFEDVKSALRQELAAGTPLHLGKSSTLPVHFGIFMLTVAEQLPEK